MMRWSRWGTMRRSWDHGTAGPLLGPGENAGFWEDPVAFELTGDRGQARHGCGRGPVSLRGGGTPDDPACGSRTSLKDARGLVFSSPGHADSPM